MDIVPQDKIKKVNSLILLLYAKRLDKIKIKNQFLENYASVPQEHRLIFWKLLLGISNSFQPQYSSSDSILNSHYNYLRRVIQEVIQIKSNNEEELNFYIYLLDKNRLPFEEPLKSKDYDSFRLIYKQMTEILDESKNFESECFYLTKELYEFLQRNLQSMKKKFHECFAKSEASSRISLTDETIRKWLLNGLAGLFHDIKIYHIIWDRLVMEETEMLVFTLISFIESCKEEQLKLINQVDFKTIPRIKLLVVDECKILKTTVKYYKSCHSSPSLPTSILNYLNSTSK